MTMILIDTIPTKIEDKSKNKNIHVKLLIKLHQPSQSREK